MYSHIIREGDVCRTAYRDGLNAFIQRMEQDANLMREHFMPTEGFLEQSEEYRAKYISMLGIDRIGDGDLPEPTITRVGEDGDAVIYRTTVYITPEIPQYGLLFVLHGTVKAPLIIAQHGGGGTPEPCSDMNGKNNYNHIVRRLLKRGAAVFAPQLLL